MAFEAEKGHLFSALAALLGALLIQIGTNLSNDYFDFVKGADTEERLGPARATQAGWIRPEIILRSSLLVFAAAVIIGIFLVLRGGWPIVLIGIASVICGILYTGGPYPLAYLGLGRYLWSFSSDPSRPWEPIMFRLWNSQKKCLLRDWHRD